MFRLTLKAARVNQGLSRKEAAVLLKIHPHTLQNWENGRTSPTYEQFQALCRLYHCTADHIFLPW